MDSLKNGVYNGKGWIAYSNGAQYIGSFLNSTATGKGALKYLNGDIYKGDVANFKQSGFGTLEIKGEGLYKGKFENNKAIGDFLFISYLGECRKLTTIKGEFVSLMYEILQNLYLGSAEAAQDAEELKCKNLNYSPCFI